MQTAANILSAITGAPPSNFGGNTAGVVGATVNGTLDANEGESQPSFGDVLANSVAGEVAPPPSLPAPIMVPVKPSANPTHLTVVPATPAEPGSIGLFLVNPSATTPPLLEPTSGPQKIVAPAPEEDPSASLVDFTKGVEGQDTSLATQALILPLPLQVLSSPAPTEPPPALPTTDPKAGSQPTSPATAIAPASLNTGALPTDPKLAIAQPFSPTGQLPDSSSPNAELATPTPQAVPVFDMNAPEPKGAPAAAAQANLAPQPPVAPMPAVAKPAEAQLAQVLSTAQPAPDNSQISTGLKPALAQVLSTAQPAPDNSQISTGLKPAAASPMNPPEPAPIASQPSIAVPTKVQDPAIKNQTIDKTAQIQGHDKVQGQVQGQVHVQGQGQVHVQVQVQGKPETKPVQPSSELAGPQTPDQPVSPAKPVSSAQTTIPADKPDNTNSLAALDSIESELESVVSVAQAPKTPSAPIAPTDKPNTAVAPTQAPPPASPALPDQILPENAVQTAQQDQAEGGPAQTAATPLGTPIKGAETLNPSASPSQPPTRSAPAHSSSEPAPSVVAANASASPGANSQSNSDQAASDSPTDPSVFGGSIKQSELSPAGTQAEAAETPTIAPIAQSNAGPTTGASVQVAANAQTVSHLASEIVRKSDGKSAQFDISLMPEGLGKVDVQISINQRGEVTASMVFDTPQAAAELRGRAAELQKSLEQSGFQVSQGGLSFTDTSGQGFSAAQQQAQQDDRRAAAQNRSFVAANDAADTVDLAAAKAYATNTSRNIDVRI